MSDTFDAAGDPGEAPTMSDARDSAADTISRVLDGGDFAADSDDAPAPPWGERTAQDLWNDNLNLTAQFHDHVQRYSPFDAINPQDADFMLGFMRAVASGDKQAIARYGGPLREALDQLGEQYDDEFDPFDPNVVAALADQVAQQRIAEFEQNVVRHQAAQQSEAAVQTAQATLMDHVEKLAAKHGMPELADPTSKLAQRFWREAYALKEPNPRDALNKTAALLAERNTMKGAANSARQRIERMMAEQVRR